MRFEIEITVFGRGEFSYRAVSVRGRATEQRMLPWVNAWMNRYYAGFYVTPISAYHLPEGTRIRVRANLASEHKAGFRLLEPARTFRKHKARKPQYVAKAHRLEWD